ncbi:MULTISPECIES: hypothetical protein [Burkholderia]|uniref:hypothetical protein n=1 Tax=Burkholderia TaxID=32008 RepID=UPI0003A4DF7F|nr:MULTISPECIES: hypothetical protein [Burkholderia]
MKDRVEIDSREKKSAKKRTEIRSIFSASGAAAAFTGRGERIRRGIRPRSPWSRMLRRGIFYASARVPPVVLAGARPCETIRFDHSIHSCASKYPQIFPNFL